jgi:ABC-type lipoprotein export system ATPase subunit
MSDPIVLAEGLEKTYEQGQVRALDGLDLVLERGEFVSVIGPSGSGKSTLLHMLGGLDRPDAGRIVIDGVDIAREPRLDRIRARSIGFVFQLHNLIPTLTAAENVELPLYALKVRASARRARARELLDAVGLSERAKHLPNQLSGGQRQRVAIARALVNRPRLVLLDEPTGDLDQATGQHVLDLLKGLRTERELTLVLVTHDPNIAAAAERTIRILDGRIVEDRINAKPPRSS